VNKLPISAYVITYNEEKSIRRCLDSLKDFSEIVIVDSFSQDQTLALCREYTDRIYQREWPGFKEQFSYALSLTSHEWVFSLDADEVASPELLEAIRRLFAGGTPADADGFYISRMTHYMGRWIRHGAWYPDYKLRLFKKSPARYEGENPHPRVEVNGKTERLEGKILHYTMENFSDHLKRLDSYTDIYAENQVKASAQISILSMIFRPLGKFLKSYIFKAGFLDGIPGFIIAVTSAFTIFARYVKFWERKQS
jgi:glycosyltransferase involved in cell wall biosynthesis